VTYTAYFLHLLLSFCTMSRSFRRPCPFVFGKLDSSTTVVDLLASISASPSDAHLSTVVVAPSIVSTLANRVLVSADALIGCPSSFKMTATRGLHKVVNRIQDSELGVCSPLDRSSC